MIDEIPRHLRYPALRDPLDIHIEQLEEQSALIIRCPLGIRVEPLVLNPVITPILQRFTGRSSIETIQSELAEQGSTIELILQVAQLLDDSFFLHGPKFEEAQKNFLDSFLDAPVRESALAGLSYPSDSSILQQEIEGYLKQGHEVDNFLGTTPLRCLMTPHIDYRRGNSCYGKTFRALQQQSPDTILLIGTSHQYSPHLFHLTTKDFNTPLGIMKTEQLLVKELAKGYGEERAFADEFLHKQEHSLELQLPFLKTLTPNSTIIPILVGSFHHMVQSNSAPSTHEPYMRFVDLLVEQIEKHLFSKGKSLLILAGVDMSHIGEYFGDNEKLSERWMEQIRTRDKQYLQCLEAQDSNALFQHVVEDQDTRRICGFPTMHTVLDIMNSLGWHGDNRILDYGQAVNTQNGCAVTFGGMAFYTPSL